MAAEGMPFSWRWNGGTISTVLDVIWGMSDKMRTPAASWLAPVQSPHRGRTTLSVVGHDTMKTRRSLEAAGHTYDYFSLGFQSMI